MVLIVVNCYLNVIKFVVYCRIFICKRFFRMIVFVWLVCVIYVSIFVILKWLVFVFDFGKIICCISLIDYNFKNVWNIIIMVVFLFIFMVILFVFYWWVLVCVCRYNIVVLCLFCIGSL